MSKLQCKITHSIMPDLAVSEEQVRVLNFLDIHVHQKYLLSGLIFYKARTGNNIKSCLKLVWCNVVALFALKAEAVLLWSPIRVCWRARELIITGKVGNRGKC